MAVAVRVNSTPRVAPASFGSRLAAYLLDALVLFILSCLFVSVGGLLLLTASDMGRTDPPDSALYVALGVSALVVPVWVVVTLAGWAMRGRSAGKLAMNLRITRRNGGRPGIARAFVRLLVYAVENLPVMAAGPALIAAWLMHWEPLALKGLAVLLLWLMAPLLSMMFVLHDGRALHDRAAGTCVIAD